MPGFQSTLHFFQSDLARYSNGWRGSALFLLGLLMVLLPAASREQWAAFCPVLVVCGACLVIRFAAVVPKVSWFNNRVLLWLGAISFSLYLVHMPLIAFYHSWYLHAPDSVGMLLLCAASLILACVFYLCIEKRKPRWSVFVLLYSLSLLLSIAGRKTDGFREYINPKINSICAPVMHGASEMSLGDIYRDFNKTSLPACKSNLFAFVDEGDFKGGDNPSLVQMGDTSAAPSVLLMGDSHAAASFPGMHATCKELGISGVYLSSLIFPFMDWSLLPLEVDKTYYCDQKKITSLFAWLEAHPEIRHVVIAQAWAGRALPSERLDWKLRPLPQTDEVYELALTQFIEELRKRNKKVILLGPTLLIRQRNVSRFVRLIRRGKQSGAPLESLCCSREKYLHDHASVLPILDKLEAGELCTVWHTLGYIPEERPFCAYEQGVMLYKDSDHMTSDGAIRLFQYLAPQVERTLKWHSGSANNKESNSVSTQATDFSERVRE